MSAAVSWSGGKESCLALHKALQAEVNVSYLLTFTSQGRCISHGLKSELMLAQSKVLGIPLIQREVTWETYGDGFKEALCKLKEFGVRTLVVGDVAEIPAHQGWVDRACVEQGVQLVKPLWHKNPLSILNEFFDNGFKAVVVKARADLLGEDWVGREVDKTFIRDIIRLENVDPCGELGEYHTFVYDGPIFEKRIKIERFEKKLVGGYWFLEVVDFSLK